jgi:NADPH:quinone reductase-like Zn-dependent oxidoreductase
MDIYQRAGTAPLPTPFVAGVEGAGEVVAVGQGVTDLAGGRRVAWLSGVYRFKTHRTASDLVIHRICYAAW